MRWIPAVAAVLLLGAAAFVAAEEKTKSPTVADLAWLAGDWTSEDGAFDETWLPPRGGAMFAVSRLVAGDKTKFCELTVVEDSPEGIVYRIRHFSSALEPWKMDTAGPMTMKAASHKEREVVFEDPAREFPRRVVYRRSGDVLTARLEGESHGKPKVEEFRFKPSAKK
jgi:hypothetical protein